MTPPLFKRKLDDKDLSGQLSGFSYRKTSFLKRRYEMIGTFAIAFVVVLGVWVVSRILWE